MADTVSKKAFHQLQVLVLPLENCESKNLFYKVKKQRQIMTAITDLI